MIRIVVLEVQVVITATPISTIERNITRESISDNTCHASHPRQAVLLPEERV